MEISMACIYFLRYLASAGDYFLRRLFWGGMDECLKWIIIAVYVI